MPEIDNGHRKQTELPVEALGELSLREAETNRVAKHLDEVPAMALDSNLMERIQADIAALGVIGESDAGLLVYLAGTSRKLNHPLRLILRGPSSAGKSFVQSKVASMCPPEDVIEATSLTPQALYYGTPGWLEHKFIVKGERSLRTDEEGADMTAALRQLISEDRIVKVVTIQMETQTIEQRGPVAFCETTTAKSIFVEDLNRCLQIHADDSVQQTRRVVLAAAESYLQTAADKDTQAILDRHRDFQRSLQYVDVRIPYACELAQALPTEKLEARRAIKQLLATIEVIAFLHQHKRRCDSQGHLLATSHDYATARRLLMGPLSESLGCGDRIWKTYELLRKRFPDGFDSTAVLKVGLFNNKMTRDRSLKQLAELGALRQVAEGKGKTPSRWSWTGNELRPVLPTAESIFASRNS